MHTYLTRQPITTANYEAAMASCTCAVVTHAAPARRVVTVRSMAEWIRDRQYVTQAILDRTFTKSEQRLFNDARELAINLSGEPH